MRYTIPRHILAASPSVFSYRIDGVRVFVKKPAFHKNPLGKLIQNILFWATGNAVIAPTAWRTGDMAESEADTIARLAARGFNVPRVLYAGRDYFVMTDAGESLDNLFARDPAARAEYVPKAAAELRRLHECGLAHGGAQIKNMAARDGKIFFLDLEEVIHPQRLAAHAIRDVFLFLLSLEQLGHDPDIDAICARYDGGAPTGMRGELRRALGQIRMIRFIEHRWFSRLRLRDIRGLSRLIGKALGPGSESRNQ